MLVFLGVLGPFPNQGPQSFPKDIVTLTVNAAPQLDSQQQHPAGYSTQTTKPHPCSDRCRGKRQEFGAQPIVLIYTFTKGYWLQPSLWEVSYSWAELRTAQVPSRASPSLVPATAAILPRGPPFQHVLQAKPASCDLETQTRSCREGLWRIPRDPFISNSLSHQPHWDLAYTAYETPLLAPGTGVFHSSRLKSRETNNEVSSPTANGIPLK